MGILSWVLGTAAHPASGERALFWTERRLGMHTNNQQPAGRQSRADLYSEVTNREAEISALQIQYYVHLWSACALAGDSLMKGEPYNVSRRFGGFACSQTRP